MAGIYIHIPFCKKLCFYCDFYHIISQGDHSELMEALKKEALLRREYTGNEIISTIYLGGGTPSVLSIGQLKGLMDSLRMLFTIEPGSEVTIELNPDDVTPQYLKDLKSLGINRISLGVQSWRDEDLLKLNRRHDSAGAHKALKEIFSAGYENVTLDLIYGIPGLKDEDWSANLDISFSYDIKHLSAYHLTIEPGTVFGKMKEKGKLVEIDEEESANQFQILIEKSEKAGFIQYEISNFAKQGFISIHNTNYWRQVSYLGLGPSAHSFNGYSRQWNPRDIRKYIKTVNEGNPAFEREELDLRTKYNEYIMTSLRTMWGIDLDYIEKVFDKEGYDYVVNLSAKFISYGLLHQDKKNLVLTNQGKLISDNIISEFMMPAID